MNIRKPVFWLLDYLRGSKIGRHYRDIATTLESDATILQSKSLEYRDNAFRYAMSKVPFYRQLANIERFEDLPLIDKSIVKQQFDQFRSADYLDVKLHKMSTSGSTGTPFTILQDKAKRQRVLAEILYFNHLVGIDLGHRLVYYRVLTKNTRKSWLLRKIQNESLVDTSNLDKDHLMKLELDVRNYPRHSCLFGYASSIETLGHFIYHEVPPSVWEFYPIEAVITGAEALSPTGRKILQSIFKCPVVSRYSNQEMGILAQQSGQNEAFALNWASYYFEIFDLNKDEPLPLGQPGRIVITDLFNLAMPLLRYDTGDIGTLNEMEVQGKSQIVLKTLEGRRVDYIIDANGNIVSPHMITLQMWDFQEIRQFQFVQEGNLNYLLRLNVQQKPFEREQEMKNRYLQLLGASSSIRFEYVNEIPTLSSGKRKPVVNEWTSKSKDDL